MPSSNALVNLLNRLQPSESTVLLALSVILGVSSGSAVLVFRWLVELAQTLYWRYLAIWLSQFHPFAIALVPIVGALVVGLLHLRLQKAETGFGQLSDAVAKEGGRLPYAQIPLKTTAAALSLGAGASLGPEGPSVELGSNIGSLLGQMLKFSSDRTRLLVSAGGAAGLAAGFNAPLAGAFFALEVLLNKSFTTTKSRVNSNVTVIVIAAVVSALVAQIGMGSQPAFNLPVYELRSYWETPLYLGLGVLASFTSLLFTRALKLAKQVFNGEFAATARFGKFNTLTKLAIAGLCVGLVAIVLPEATGIGYATIESILQDSPFSIGLLLILLVTKLILTAICAASGFVGGTFAPAIFLGAILGSAYGQILAVILPHSIAIAAPPAYALVGMAAVLAGSIRAPLTAVLLLFEMTRDYRIVLPLTAAVVLCVWLTEHWQPRQATGYDFGTAAFDPNSILSKIKISEIMTRSPLQFNHSMPVLPAAQILANSYFHSALIVGETHELIGILTSQDIERILLRPNEQLRKLNVSEVCTYQVLSAFGDETLSDALRRMAPRDLHQLPVVDRQQPGQILGIIDRQAITNAFSNLLTKQAITEKIASSKAEALAKPVIDHFPEPTAASLTEEIEIGQSKSEPMVDKLEFQSENRGTQVKPDRIKAIHASVPVSVWEL